MAILDKVLLSDTLKTMVSKINRIIEVVKELPDLSQHHLKITRPTPTGEIWANGQHIYKLPLLIGDYSEEQYEKYFEYQEDELVTTVTFHIWEYLKSVGVIDPDKCLMLSNNLFLCENLDKHDTEIIRLFYDKGDIVFTSEENLMSIYGTFEFCTNESNLDISIINN